MAAAAVYVVRVWRDAGAFRATARAVEKEETVMFSEPMELMRFLDRGVPGPVSASEHDHGKTNRKDQL